MSTFIRQHIEQIVTLTDSEFESIRQYYSPRRLRRRQFLVQEQQPVDDMYLVEKGLLKTSKVDNEGKEHIVQFASEHWWVSDFAAFYKREPATLSIDCLEDTELWSISYNGLAELCRRFPKMEHFSRVKGNFGYVAIQQRLVSMMTQSVKERYLQFLQQYPHLQQRIPKQLIAGYLGVSRETLSRITL